MNGLEKIIPLDGRDIKVVLQKFAPQAAGSILISSGETAVLVTANRAGAREGIDFLPLVVDYEERLYAAGRIPGGFLRREGRPPEKAILIGRLIDRPLRPLFPQWLRDDLQVVATTVSLDENVPPDVLAVTGASIAVLLAQIPFHGPMAAVRVGLVGDEFIINPTYQEIERGGLDLVVAGTPDGVVMVEAGANQLPEADMVEAIDFGYEVIQDLIQAQRDLLTELGLEIIQAPPPVVDPTLENFIYERATAPVTAILKRFEKDKNVRDAALDEVQGAIAQEIANLPPEDPVAVAAAANPKALATLFKAVTKKLMRQQIITEGVRVDGRRLDEVRPIWCEVGVLPDRVHGSALFNRGLTQVLSVTTLGSPADAQALDDLHPEDTKRYLHHYNFPPYSVGEVRPLRSPGRREIGHGALAERALEPVLPPKDQFPYVIRVVSEVLSSDGSTSMASVCGSTLSLMDTGVPISKPVSGAAMGLIKEGDEIRILTDIQGIEDFLGDMDFKVAGTDSGITALQMDMKITGLPVAVIKQAIEQARPARLHILEKMLAVIGTHRLELRDSVPRLLTLQIPADTIGLVIGPGGKTVRGISEQFGVKIDIAEDGIVTISAPNAANAKQARSAIEALTRKLNAGDVYLGKVTRIIPIGAFVEFLPGKEGMIHISQLAEYRVGKVEDEVNVGDEIVVKIREVDNKGRINLTRLGIHPDEAQAVHARANR
ncbi:polyribonucleotide nucleotidyltransferase [Synechococcus sp. PCC 6716]|nr:polyribonucleotide nucleotidyltransferase [Synechococcus sp. PCC 6716]